LRTDCGAHASAGPHSEKRPPLRLEIENATWHCYSSIFALTVAHMQTKQPLPGSSLERQFEMGDYVFTAIFTIELSFNMTAHWCSAVLHLYVCICI